MTVNKLIIDEIQFPEDEKIYSMLKESMQIVSFIQTVRHQEFERRKGCSKLSDMLSNGIMELNPVLAPKVYDVYRKVSRKLDVDFPISIFCDNDPQVNGAIVSDHYINPEHPEYVMIISSGALEKLDADELAFFMGHELGHICYRHDLLEPVKKLLKITNKDEEKESVAGLPVLVEKDYVEWRYKREISCDRVGILACEKVESAVRAMVKSTSGIYSDIITDDIDSLIAYMIDLCTRPSEIVKTFKDHPDMPVRIASMAKFASFLDNSNSLEEINKQISEIFKRKSRYPYQLLHEAVMKVLTIGGLAIFRHKGDVTDKEINGLIDVLYNNFTDRPEDEVEKALHQDSFSQLEDFSETIKNTGSEYDRNYTIINLCRFALLDGHLDEQEKAFITELGRKIGVPKQDIIGYMVSVIRKEGLVMDSKTLSMLEEINNAAGMDTSMIYFLENADITAVEDSAKHKAV